jgi:DNA transposition AAA+ family ATPase
MKYKMVKTKDVRFFMQATDDLINRPMGTEGMGLMCGPPGTGKTTTLAFCANVFDGIYMRAVSCWTVTSMLADLCRFFGGVRMHRRADMVCYIVEELTKENRPVRPIFLDEADYCLKHDEMIESLRDIYDLSGCPVILIGMEDFARRIRENEKVARRITQWIEFKGVDIEDTAKVASECCEVELASDLIEYLHKETMGNIGRLIIGLRKIETYAKVNNKSVIAASDWGERPLYFDQPTFVRKKKRNYHPKGV